MAVTADIHSINGNSYTVVLESSSVRHLELMSKDYVRLVFSTDKKININVGDSVGIDSYGTFYITEPQKGTYNKTTGGYDYDLQFNAPYFLWKNKIYKFDPGKEGKNETTWSLTGNLEEHMAVFLENLKEYGYSYEVEDSIYKIESSQRVVYIQFDKTSLFDALTQIAEKFSYEWAVDGGLIYFGNIIRDDLTPAVSLTMGDNVEDMSAQDSNNDAINRYYVFGSTRNIPQGYRQKDTGIVMNGVVQKRLMLPKGIPYIDTRSDMKPNEIVEGVLVLDDIYPRTKSKVATVTAVEKDMETTTAAAQQQPTEPSSTTAGSTKGTTSGTTTDGTTTDGKKTEKVNVYRFTTKDFTFSKDYILSGQTLQVQFQSGKLNGMTFDVAFNPDGESEKTVKKDENGKEIAGETESNPSAQVFELVRNDTYGITLPNDTIHPEVDDTFVLLGWDANKMSAWKELITKAEKELEDRARTYISSREEDPLTYTCTMMSDWMYGLNEEGEQDASFTKVGTFFLGMRVSLSNEAFFGSSGRQSRVVGYEYKLDIPYDGAEIYCGESAFYSKNKATQSTINEVKESVLNHQGGGENGGGGGEIRLIRSSDRVTPASDTTAYSSLRSDMDFAHKRKDDNISALWTFNNGYGASRGIRTHQYRNKGNEGNVFGKGFELVEQLDSNGNTETRLEVDKLLVRVKAFFTELEIRKISYVGGNFIFTAAGSKVYYVEWLDASGNVLDKSTSSSSEAAKFRCYLYSDDGTTATMNYFAEDDQIICQQFNIDEGVHKNVSNRYWWRRVPTGSGSVGKGKITALGDDKEYQYVDVSNLSGEYATDSDVPEVGDTIVTFGNWSNKNRQGVIYLSVEGELAPAIIEYDNLGADGKHFQMPDEPKLQLSPKGNIIYGKFISVNESSTDNTGKSIDEMINQLMEELEEIRSQADKKFDIYLESYAPHPLKGEDFSTANYPASEWTTDALKALHVQDLFYDTDKDPASDGGRAWRWVSEATTSTTTDETTNTTSTTTTTTYFWEVVRDQDTLDALEKVRKVQNEVDDIVSDGIISRGSEKSELLIEWNKAMSNYAKYFEQANDYKLTGDVAWTAYSSAFFAVAKMLNNGEDYTEADRSNSVTPSWLDVTKDTKLEDTPIKTADAYRNTWDAYYLALAELLKAITIKAKTLADDAQKSADEQKERIDDIVADGVLDAAEKISVKKEFLSLWHEIADDGGLYDKGHDDKNKFYSDDVSNACQSMTDAFNSLATYLNGGNAWSLFDSEKKFVAVSEASVPLWISTDATSGIGVSQTITASEYRSKWSSYYSARAAYIAMLSKNAQKSADEKIQVFTSDTVPTPPYKVGDLWIQTDKNNNVMICITGREAGDGNATDWTDLSDLTERNDPRNVMIPFGDVIYDLSGGYIKSNGSIKVHLNHDLVTTNDGDLELKDDRILRCIDTAWAEITNSTWVNVFKAVYDLLGSRVITVYSQEPTDFTPNRYDLVLFIATWTDPFRDGDDKEVDSGVSIFMYNNGVWETLRLMTKSIAENLGDELRNIVFGTDEGHHNEIDASGLVTTKEMNTFFSEKVRLDENGNITNISKSGLVTTSDFASLFSEQLAADGTVVKKSEMSVYVTKDGNNYISNAKIKADNIELEGLTTINSYFKVLEDGSIEAVNANITGTITATTGEIGGFTISGNGLTNIVSKDDMKKEDMGYVICRNDYHGRFAGIGANVLPASSGSAAVARFENNDTEGWYTQNIAMILEARGKSSWEFGSGTQNIACATYGGCFTGFALGVKIVNALTSAQTVYLTRSDNVVTCIGSEQVDLYLLDAYPYDDGHVFIIKRDGGCSVRIHPYYYHDANNVKQTTYLRYDQGSIVVGTTDYLELKSWMDSIMLIFHKGLYITKDKTDYYGAWIEYKLPRNW